MRHCHGFTNCAPQQRRYTLLGVGKYQAMGEDCLTLNVVAPEGSGRESLPVMVFVHGGGYILGSSATPYDGAALARRRCVYVSVNYRLGTLGCLDLSSLSTSDITIESNLYLRDLVMALGWVRDNIAAFGGDPGNVTLFGESAGAHAVATLLAVPAAKGLFSQVISESPAAGMVRSRGVAAEFASRFAALIGVRRQDAADALIQASPAELVSAQDRLIDEGMQNRLGAFPIGPVFGDDCLPLDPVEAMRRGRAHRVPLIVGTNADEGRLFTRFLRLLPTTEPMIEELLADTDPAARERLPPPIPDIRVSRPVSGSAAISPLGRPPGRLPRPTAAMRLPTFIVTTSRHGYCTGLGWAPPMPRNCWLFSTFTAPSSVRCWPPPLTGEPRCASATRSRAVGAPSAAPGCPATVGRHTPTPTVRSWFSTADAASNSTRTPSAEWHGRASP